MKANKAIRLLFINILAVIVARSQPQIGGFVEYDNITYFKNIDEQKINGRNQVILQVELSHRINANADIFGAVEFRNDQDDPARDRIYLDEVFLNLYVGNFDIRIGKQIYAWGRADGFNPTDNLTVWDFSDILDTEDEKIGLISGWVNYYAGNWTLAAVLAPSFVPSVLPLPNSRWFPQLPESVPNPLYPQFGPPALKANYIYAPQVLPDQGFESTQYALKLSGFASGWDYSLSWFDGFDDLPAIHTSTEIDSSLTTAEITLENRYHRRQAIGVDFATTSRAFGVRGEAAYYITEDWKGTDPNIDDPYFQYALGVDYTFRDLFAGKDLFILLQWLQEIQIPDRGTEYRIFDLNHIFRKSFFGKADLKLGEFSRLTFEGVWNIDTEDWWMQPGFEWSITDGVHLLATVDLLDGPQDSFFGIFSDNNRFQFRLKYSF